MFKHNLISILCICSVVIGSFNLGCYYNKTHPTKQVQTDSIALKEANYRTLPYKVQLIRAYNNYYKGAEEVMDLLQQQYINGSIDSTAAYAHYLKARVKLDSLCNLEE